MRGQWKREVPVVLSLVLPGLGQLYNRQWVKGVALVLLSLWMSARVMAEVTGRRLEEMSLSHLLVGLAGLLAILGYAIVDSRRVAARRLAA
jgi:hypothetical protein